jgi:hypothetical protein
LRNQSCFKAPRQNRHPERSASQIYRKQRALWRGVEGPRLCFLTDALAGFPAANSTEDKKSQAPSVAGGSAFPSRHETEFRSKLTLSFCHPERSRGICSSTDLSWKCFRSKPQNRMRLIWLLQSLDLRLIQANLQRLDCLIQVPHLAGADDR